MITAQHHRSSQTTFGNRIVEGLGDFHSAQCISVQDSRLRAHHQSVGLSALDPTNVVVHLLLDFSWRLFFQFFQDLASNGVCQLQICGFATCAHPTEWAETIIKAHGAHDILNITRIPKSRAFFVHYVRPGTRSFQQKSVAIIEEISSTSGVFVDRIRMPPQGFSHMLCKFLGLVSHHLIGCLE